MSLPEQENFSNVCHGDEILVNNKINSLNLPANFYENLLNHENKLIYTKSFKTINQLMEMYKIGVEFYCQDSSSKQICFMNKIKDLLMNKKIVKIIEENKQMYNSYLSTIESISEIESYVNDNEMTELHNNYSSELIEDISHPAVTKYKLRKLNSRNQRKNLNNNRRKCSTKINTKLSHNSLIINSSMKIKKRFHNLIRKKSNLQKEKEIMDSSGRMFKKAMELINNDLQNQNLLFQTSLKHRQLETLRIKFISNFNKDSKVNNKQAIRKKLTITQDRFAPKLKTSFKNMISPMLTNSSKNLKLLKKCRKKIISINQVFDFFLGKLRKIYFKYVCEELCSLIIKIVNKYYIDRINNYIKIEDEIEDLIHLDNEDLNSYHSKSIDLIIKKLYLERDTFNIEKESISKYDIENSKKINTSFSSLHIKEIFEITDELIKKLINLISNSF